jgi:hypothetical protein
MIAGSLQGSPLQFVFPDYRNYQYTQQLTRATASQISFPIPAKFSSLKSIFVTQRDRGTGAATYYPFSSCALGISDYQFRIGSQVIPSKAVNTNTEMFAEVLKAIGSLGDLNHQPSIEKYSYSMNSSVVNTVALEANGASNAGSGSFYIGLNLENYEGASKDTIFSGWNSNTDDLFAIINLGNPPDINASPNPYSVRWDAFALFDCVLVCENNTAYVKF